MKLLRWQSKALAKWVAAGHRGVVEAVTGSGKTYLGLAAIEQVWETHGSKFAHPLVVVPTAVLLDQWCERLAEAFPGKKIGRMSKDDDDDFSRHDVCVRTRR